MVTVQGRGFDGLKFTANPRKLEHGFRRIGARIKGMRTMMFQLSGFYCTGLGFRGFGIRALGFRGFGSWV